MADKGHHLCDREARLDPQRYDKVARVAPVGFQDLRVELGRVDTIVRWRSSETSDWMTKINGTSELLENDPHRA